MEEPKTREECIKLIDTNNWRRYFKDLYWQTPEDYFTQYASDEPDIWLHVLDDLENYVKAI